MDLDRAVEPVVLDVGGKKFYTTIGSLTDRSGYFESLFSGRWPIPRREDASIFVDADPKVFSHILSYLRHGIFPLCYNPETGHDYSLYQEILTEAKYYQLPKLELWLTNHCYDKAVSISITTRRRSTEDAETETFTSAETVSLEQCHITTEPYWLCPSTLRREHKLKSSGFHGCCQVEDVPKEGKFVDLQKVTWLQTVKKVAVLDGWCSDRGNEFEQYWEHFTKDSA